MLSETMRKGLLPLLPKRLRPYAKSILLLAGNVIAVLQFLYADNPKVAALVMIATQLGVFAQPNDKLVEVQNDVLDLEIDVPLD